MSKEHRHLTLCPCFHYEKEKTGFTTKSTTQRRRKSRQRKRVKEQFSQHLEVSAKINKLKIYWYYIIVSCFNLDITDTILFL